MKKLDINIVVGCKRYIALQLPVLLGAQTPTIPSSCGHCKAAKVALEQFYERRFPSNCRQVISEGVS